MLEDLHPITIESGNILLEGLAMLESCDRPVESHGQRGNLFINPCRVRTLPYLKVSIEVLSRVIL